MNSASSHLPKTRKMKTTPEHITNEVVKQLFRQLFEAQIELERNPDDMNPRLRRVILTIDDLLERILDYTEG